MAHFVLVVINHLLNKVKIKDKKDEWLISQRVELPAFG